jgi:hypothetical protein
MLFIFRTRLTGFEDLNDIPLIAIAKVKNLSGYRVAQQYSL